MIRVNLLPPEYRKAEATPLKQFFATVGAVVLGAVAAVAWGWVHFTQLKPAEKRLEDLTTEITNQKGGLDYTQKLEGKVKDLKDQFKLIDEVAKNRVVWSREMDQFWDITVNPKSPGRYEVWLDGLACSATTAGLTASPGGTIQFAGTSAGAQAFRYADFWEDLSTSPFFADFKTISPPSGLRQVVPPADRDPQEGWVFNFKLELKPLKDISEAHSKPAAEAPKK